MVRYTPDQFLTEYTKFLNKANTNKTGSVELTFKRYDAADEQNLPPTNDKTGVPKTKPTKKKLMTKGGKGAANPELNKKKAHAKPTAAKPQASPDGDSPADLAEPSVLIRARFSTKKVSCVVPAKEVSNFNEQFRTIFRLYNKSLVPRGQDSERMKLRKQASTKSKK